MTCTLYAVIVEGAGFSYKTLNFFFFFFKKDATLKRMATVRTPLIKNVTLPNFGTRFNILKHV